MTIPASSGVSTQRQPTAGAAEPVTTARPSAFANGDFETFLKMLTAQIRNQDPLNPMEGSDFAVQLATFSGVEQQVRTNDLLKAMGESLGGAGLSQFAGWIGKSVRTTGPVHFAATPLTLDLAPDPRADRVLLVARNAQGQVVSREEVGRGTGEVDWFGRDEQGAKLPDGAYTLALEQYQGETRLPDTKVGAYARVLEAKIGPAGPQLVLDGGSTVPADSVTALRGQS